MTVEKGEVSESHRQRPCKAFSRSNNAFRTSIHSKKHYQTVCLCEVRAAATWVSWTKFDVLRDTDGVTRYLAGL